MNARSNNGRVDELDRGIIERLSRDARISNRGIALELGVTEGTVRSRIKRLQSEGLIQFTVVTDFRMAGSPNLCMIGVDCDPAKVETVGRALSEFPELTSVIVLLGRYSLLATGLFTSVEKLSEIATTIRAMPGVQRVETSVSVKNLKYDAGIAKITAR